MQTFNFPIHTIEKVYPQTGVGVKFGNSYEFRSPSPAPDQVEYRLSMKGLKYFFNSNGTLNRTINPTRNILFLEDFYLAHKLHAKFLYVHQADGTVTVRFKNPLIIPTAYATGRGELPPFEVILISQP